MRNFFKFLLLNIVLIQLSLGQIDFIPSNNITVLKNNMEMHNAWAGGMNACQFSKIDLNMDGIEDLFVFDKSAINGVEYGNRIMTFVYDPLLEKYQYSPEYISFFPELKNWVLLIDYNQDSKVDIFTCDPNLSSVAVYTNTSESNLSFDFYKTLYSDAGFVPQPLYVDRDDIPAIADIDGDSDFDILTFSPNGSYLYFHENKSMQMDGNNDSIYLYRSDNCWGRFKEADLTNSVTLNLTDDCCECTIDDIDGDCIVDFNMYGIQIDPEITEDCTEDNGRSAHSGSTILAFDVDPANNQGLEVLLGDLNYDNMVMLQNGGNDTTLIVDQDTSFPSYDNPIDLTRFPGAFYLDVDNDNLKDLLISPNAINTSNHKNSWFYKNTGNLTSENNMIFEYIENNFMIKDMIDLGSNAKPLLYDLNNDNLLDLVISSKGYFETGNYQSRISLFKNTGSANNPVFEFVSDNFSNLSLLGDSASIFSIHPTFGDLDNDQDIDMIIGDNNGQIYYFENTIQNEAGSEFPIYQNYELLDIDVGSFAHPQLIDLNRDGLLDLVIGERMGIDNCVYNGINYYQNTGSPTEAEFENYTPEFDSGVWDEDCGNIITKSLGGIHLGIPTYLTAYTTPHIFEYNEVYYLAVGTGSGFIYLYNNVENFINNTPNLNLNSEFNLLTNSMLEINNSIYSTVAIEDLNNDNLPDLLRGNASGGLELYFGLNFNVRHEQEHTSTHDITIKPNPNNGKFNIENPNNTHYTVSIISSLGQIISKEEISTSKYMEISDPKKGFYILEFKNATNQFVKKVICH